MAITYNAGTNIITLTGSGTDPAGGISWANAYTMEQVLAACGAAVTKQGANAYDVSARMKFESGVYFKSESEFVELKPNPINPVYTIRADAGTHIMFGEYDAHQICKNGAFWQIYLQSTTGSQQVTGNRLMGEFLCYGSNVICDSTAYQRGPHFVAGGRVRLYSSVCKWSGYFWATDCNMQDIKFHGGGGTYDMLFATGYDYAFSGVTSLNCNYGLFFSSTTNAPVDVYNQKFENCHYDIGLISTTHLIRVINSPFTTFYPVGIGKSFKDCYEFNVKVTDDQGAPLIGAVVTLSDVDGNPAFPAATTVTGGVLPGDEIVVRKWYRHANQGGIKDYNDHTLRVTYGTDVTEYKIKIDHKITEDVVVVPQSVASYDDIMAGIDDLKGTGFVKDTDSVVNIRPETDKIQTGIIDVPGNYKANLGALHDFDPTTEEVDIGKVKGVPVLGTDDFKANLATLHDFDPTTEEVDIGKVKGGAVAGTADFRANLTVLEARLTAARALLLDKLNVAGTLAHSGAAGTYKANLTTLEERLTAARALLLDKLDVVGTLANSTDADDYKADLALLEAIAQGDWRIEANQMIFKHKGGADFAWFNLFDVAGQPAETGVYRRVNVTP